MQSTSSTKQVLFIIFLLYIYVSLLFLGTAIYILRARLSHFPLTSIFIFIIVITSILYSISSTEPVTDSRKRSLCRFTGLLKIVFLSVFFSFRSDTVNTFFPLCSVFKSESLQPHYIS
jgi:hypothetical protein